jgi:hypothetical protein
MSVGVVVFLSCAQSAQIVEAEVPSKYFSRQGTASKECKPLEEKVSILVVRNPETLCAETVDFFTSSDCTGEPIRIDPLDPEKDPKLPKGAFSGSGNQFCPEAFVKYVNSDPCYEYISGGRTRYIPKG